MYLELKLELNYQVMRFLKEEEIIIKKEEKFFLFNFMTNKIKKTMSIIFENVLKNFIY